MAALRAIMADEQLPSLPGAIAGEGKWRCAVAVGIVDDEVEVAQLRCAWRKVGEVLI